MDLLASEEYKENAKIRQKSAKYKEKATIRRLTGKPREANRKSRGVALREGRFKCDICGFVTVTNQSLNIHLGSKRHETKVQNMKDGKVDNFPCDVCVGVGFETAKQLSRHKGCPKHKRKVAAAPSEAWYIPPRSLRFFSSFH